jgi:hypothetical protein
LPEPLDSNNGLNIEGRSAEEVADALSTMNLAIGTLEMLINNLLNHVEISLPEKTSAGEAAKS